MPLHARDRIGLEILLDQLYPMSHAHPRLAAAIREIEAVVDGVHLSDDAIEKHLATAGRIVATVPDAPRWWN